MMSKFIPSFLLLTCLIAPQAQAAYGVICDDDDIRVSASDSDKNSAAEQGTSDAARTAKVCVLVSKHTGKVETKEVDSSSLWEEIGAFMIDLTQ